MLKRNRWIDKLLAVGCCTGVAAFAGGGGGDVDLVAPDQQMVFWTWVTFALLLVILHNFAWKPILSALTKRENEIRDSVENAERIRQEMLDIEASRKRIITEADDKAKEIVTSARHGAVELSKSIEEKARDKAKIMVENAVGDITAAQQKAAAQLRREAADVAVAIAGKLIASNLNDTTNRALVDNLISEI